MTDPTNFWIAWAVYCMAGMIYYIVFWRITRFRRHKLLSYSLRAVMLAIVATPWYVSDTGTAMAPALIIVLMDAITIGGDAAVRAFVPLFLSTMIALVGVLLFMLVRRGRPVWKGLFSRR